MTGDIEGLPPTLPPPVPEARAAVPINTATKGASQRPPFLPRIAGHAMLLGFIGMVCGVILGPIAVFVTLLVVSLSVGHGGQAEWSVWVIALLPTIVLAGDERLRESFGVIGTGCAVSAYKLYRTYEARLHDPVAIAAGSPVAEYTAWATWAAAGAWGLVGAAVGAVIVAPAYRTRTQQDGECYEPITSWPSATSDAGRSRSTNFVNSPCTAKYRCGSRA